MFRIETRRTLRLVVTRTIVAASLVLPVSVAQAAPADTTVGQPDAGNEEPGGSDSAGDPGSSSPDDQRLQELFTSARTLYDEGQYEAAITAFQAAYDVSPEPNLLYNIYVCYDRLDRLDEALVALDRYAAVAPPEEEGQIERDRRNLMARIKRRDSEQPAGKDAGDTTPGGGTTGPVDEPEPLFGPAAWTLTAVTGVALGLGIGFGVASNNQANDAQDQCGSSSAGPICPTSAQTDMDRARTLGIVADVSFAVAGAAAIGLITVLAVKASRRKKARSAAAMLSPYASPSTAGLQLGGRF